jgi:hypothetical protein
LVFLGLLLRLAQALKNKLNVNEFNDLTLRENDLCPVSSLSGARILRVNPLSYSSDFTFVYFARQKNAAK